MWTRQKIEMVWLRTTSIMQIRTCFPAKQQRISQVEKYKQCWSMVNYTKSLLGAPNCMLVKEKMKMEVNIQNTHLHRDVTIYYLENLKEKRSHTEHTSSLGSRKISWIRAKTIQINGNKSCSSNNKNHRVEGACYSTNLAKAIMHLHTLSKFWYWHTFIALFIKQEMKQPWLKHTIPRVLL